MAYRKTLPRHNGRLLLHQANLWAELDIPENMNEPDLQWLLESINRWFELAKGSFELATGRELFIEDNGDGYYWFMAEDTTFNSSQYQWLSSKARKLFSWIAKRTTESIEFWKANGSFQEEVVHGAESSLDSEDHSREEP